MVRVKAPPYLSVKVCAFFDGETRKLVIMFPLLNTHVSFGGLQSDESFAPLGETNVAKIFDFAACMMPLPLLRLIHQCLSQPFVIPGLFVFGRKLDPRRTTEPDTGGNFRSFLPHGLSVRKEEKEKIEVTARRYQAYRMSYFSVSLVQGRSWILWHGSVQDRPLRARASMY